MSFDLEKESDVKEYLEKLGIEYRFGCYSEKKPEVCHLLGDYLEAIKKDFEKASKVYRSNCDDYGYAHSCLKYGNYTFLGKGKSGTKGSPADAFKYYEKGCDLKNPECCLHSGLIMVSKAMESEVKRNVPKGIELLKKSCDMNNATACFYLSGMHISGVQHSDDNKSVTSQSSHNTDSMSKNSSSSTSSSSSSSSSVMGGNDFVIQRDMNKAFQFAYKACELKNVYACANLSQMYARGDGTEKNPEKAEKFKKLAMEMQEELKNPQPQLGFQQGIL